jgi:translation initiation factor eIF-2B subunit delta
VIVCKILDLKPTQKQVALFSHLPQYERPSYESLTLRVMRNQTTTTTTTATATVSGVTELTLHPEIVRLGLMYANRLITGANARCVAMLHAFRKVFPTLFSPSLSLSLPLPLRKVFSLFFCFLHSLIFVCFMCGFQMIEDYKSHPQKPFALDLDSKLKPSIQYLADCRSLSLGMRNVIKHLRVQIGTTTQMNEEQVFSLTLFFSLISFITFRHYRAISHTINQSHTNTHTFTITSHFCLVS